MPHQVTTITISIANGAIVVTPSESEDGKAVGRKYGRVHWQGDHTVTGMWAVGLKGDATPFRYGRRAFSQVGGKVDGEKIKWNAKDGDEFQYSVFCQAEAGANESLFEDPIIVIRNSSNDFRILVAEETKDLAAEARQLAEHAEAIAAIPTAAGS